MAGGFFDGLEDKITSPLFLAGAGLLSGEGFGGAMQGLQMGTGLQGQRRKQAEDAKRQAAFQQLTQGGQLQGISPDVLKLAQAAGPDAGFGMLAGAVPKPRDALDEEYKRAQISAMNRRGAEGDGKPANWQEWELYNSLSEKDQLRYNAMKRGEQWKNAGTHYVNPGNPTQTIPIDNAGKAAQTAIGKGQGEAASALPKAKANVDIIKSTVKQLLAHPGRSEATGYGSLLPDVAFTNRRGKGFIDLFNQAQGGAFLDGYEMLKGGGSVTEIEGQKAQQARNRMTRAATEEDFNAAAKDFVDAVDAGYAKLEAKARGSGVGTGAAAPSGWSLKKVD
jgi:hypothetical protein